MNFNILPLAVAVFISTFRIAAGQTSPAIDLEARKASILTVESHITHRKLRLTELRQDIVTIDGRIEKRLDELVKMLVDTTDSQDSKRKVSQLKLGAIQGLRRSIDLYANKRREISERIKKGDEAALADLGKFDERINNRIAQIVELSKSFPAHEDVKKYESYGNSYWNGYDQEVTRISEDWKQSRRDNAQGKKQRDEINAAIRDGIERLDQRRRSLQDALANRSPSDSARKLYTQELGQIDAQSESLKSQLVEITMSTGGATQQPSQDEAVDLGEMLDDARKDLRSDVSSLFRLYDEFDRERANLAGLSENLVARKAWLEKNTPAEN